MAVSHHGQINTPLDNKAGHLPFPKLLARALAVVVALSLLAVDSPLGSAAPVSASSLGISGLTASTSTPALYSKLELTFNVDNTVATNLQFPYDPAPPTGLAAGVGVTVDGLFLPPGQTDWSLALVQPGFLYQGYQRQQIGGNEWLYPQGSPVWKIRFAPATTGAWQYQVRVQDSSICSPGVNPCSTWVQSSIGTFTAVPALAGQHGFLHVSSADPRYFEFSDGTPFIGQGHDDGFGTSDFTYQADSKLPLDNANGITFLRVWMSGENIAGSAWSPWAWWSGPNYGGYLFDPGIMIAPNGSGHDFVFNLDQSANRSCIFNGWSQGQIAVKPGTTYQISATVQVANIAGPRNPGNPSYGFTLKAGNWSNSCPDDLSSNVNLVPYVRSTNGWTTVQGTFTTTSSQNYLNYLYMMLDNVSGGQAYVSQVSLKEVQNGGALGPEIIYKGQSDAHLDFNLKASWDWDYALDLAAQNNVYLKLVVLEKNDRVWNDINADGSLADPGSNNNFYAAPNTKVRALHDYYWRYLSARWGYSTAVHSWELMNEGDPYNGNHYNQANSFAQSIHQLDPNRHMATTSTWGSFPAAQFWGNPQYPDIDYADVHAYITTGFGPYEWSAPTGTTLDTNPADTYAGSAGAIQIPAGVVSGNKQISIRGQGTWTVSALVKAQNIVGTCPYGVSSTLAGPQMLVGLDSPNSTTVPPFPGNPSNYWNCTSPAGTYDYTPVSGTITVADSSWHYLAITFQTSFATSGTAWFDNLTITSPSGKTGRLYGSGSFDDRLRMDNDTAWYSTVYSLLDGAQSVSGAGKPVVRGEAGLDSGQQVELAGLANDTHGVWLHNYLWGALNSGGMYELYWWTTNIIQNSLYFQYKPVHDFLTGIPINNGHYRDAQAVASASSVRALGQKDLFNNQAHLWIQNLNHTWNNVVGGTPWGQLSGTVTVSELVPNQTYSLEWWEFDDPGNLTQQTTTATADANGNLTINLAPLPASVTDAAVKIVGTTGGYSAQLSPIIK